MRKMFPMAALLLLAMTTVAGESTSPVFRVVPGSGAGYLYFPASVDSRATLTINKEGMFRDYEVWLQGETEADELLCAKEDVACEKKLGAGSKVRLSLKNGDFARGLLPGGQSLPVLVATWSGNVCPGHTEESCEPTLLPGQNIVRVETDCNGSDYSETSVGSGARVLCMGQYMGRYLVAAHKNIDNTGRRPRNSNSSWSGTTIDDGPGNTGKLTGYFTSSPATLSSAHYCSGLRVGGLADWYLPANNELNLSVINRPAQAIQRAFFTSTLDNTNVASLTPRLERHIAARPSIFVPRGARPAGPPRQASEPVADGLCSSKSYSNTRITYTATGRQRPEGVRWDRTDAATMCFRRF